jgi:hypothetical protein
LQQSRAATTTLLVLLKNESQVALSRIRLAKGASGDRRIAVLLLVPTDSRRPARRVCRSLYWMRKRLPAPIRLMPPLAVPDSQAESRRSRAIFSSRAGGS